MTVEVINAAAAVGTFAVIAVTALAAVVQLRHLRTSNQINAMLSLMQMEQNPVFEERLHFVRTELASKMEEPAFRAGLDSTRPVDRTLHPEWHICSWFEQIGIFVKYGMIDAEAYFDLYDNIVQNYWNLLAPAIVVARRQRGDTIYENFEYLTSRARLWREQPRAFPKGIPRLPLSDPWLAADRATPGSTAESSGR